MSTLIVDLIGHTFHFCYITTQVAVTYIRETFFEGFPLLFIIGCTQSCESEQKWLILYWLYFLKVRLPKQS